MGTKGQVQPNAILEGAVPRRMGPDGLHLNSAGIDWDVARGACSPPETGSANNVRMETTAQVRDARPQQLKARGSHRQAELDALRGLMLVLMTLAHLPTQ